MTTVRSKAWNSLCWIGQHILSVFKWKYLLIDIYVASVSWLLWIVLQGTLGCPHLFELWFSSDICPEVGLLDHMLVFFVGCGNFHRFIEQLSKIRFKGRVLESFNESNPTAHHNILSYGYIWTHGFWNYSADKKQ